MAGQTGLSDEFLYLNLGRSALAVLVKAYKLRQIQLPFYTCPQVWHSIARTGCTILPYEIDDLLLPVNTDPEIPLLYTNYFGVCGSRLEQVLQSHAFVIVDNAQAYYAPPRGKGSIYSPRKFFGLPDGGILWPKFSTLPDLPIDQSWQRCAHLLKRSDLDARSAYEDYKASEELLDEQPPGKMSRLTQKLLAMCDTERAREIRLNNFKYLHNSLAAGNLLKLEPAEDDVPLVYPFRSAGTGLREKLIAAGIFVAKYWPADSSSQCMRSGHAEDLAESILPLPIDQRYGSAEMDRMLEKLGV